MGRTGKGHPIQYIISAVIILCMIITAGAPAFAAEGEVVLSVDATTLEMGASTNLTLVVNQQKKVKQVEIQGIDNFDILSSSQSSSTRIINGVSSSEKSYQLIIMPKAEGDYTLKAIVTYSSGIVESNEVSMTVKAGSTATDLQGEQGDIFIKTSVQKDQYYLGERFVLSYDLYTRYNIDDYGFTEDVTLDGFISDEISKDDLNATYATVNGLKYLKYEVKKLILTPTQSGEITIPAFNFQANVSTGDLFGRSEPQYLKSDEVKLNIKDVPSTGQPAGYSGLVGSLSVATTYNKDSINYGEPDTMEIKLSGTANLDLLQSLYGREQDGYTIYETPKTAETAVDGDRVSSEKTYEIILVPTRTGEITVNPVSIPYFDTDKGEYSTVSIEGKTITVTGEASSGQTTGAGQSSDSSAGQTVAAAGAPIVISQVSYPEEAAGDVFVIKLPKIAAYILLFILTLAAMAFAILRRMKRRGSQNSAATLLKAVRGGQDAADLYALLNEMIKADYGISMKSSSKREVREVIADPKESQQVADLIEYLEHEKFYPTDSLDVVKSKMTEVIKNLKSKKAEAKQ